MRRASVALIACVTALSACRGCEQRRPSRRVELPGLEATIDIGAFAAPGAAVAGLDHAGQNGQERLTPSPGTTTLTLKHPDLAASLTLAIQDPSTQMRTAVEQCVPAVPRGAKREKDPASAGAGGVGVLVTEDVVPPAGDTGVTRVVTYTAFNGAVCYWLSGRVPAGDAKALAAVRTTLDSLTAR